MKFTKMAISGVYIIEHDNFSDERGSFIKLFNEQVFLENKVDFKLAESYFTESLNNVLRGMHFQIPQYDHNKIATVISGKVLDVILDIRKSSPTYKKFITVELSRENRKSVYIPKGCAHGFLSQSTLSIVFYMTSTVYSVQHDKGLRWDSFGFEWPVLNPIISKRDESFPVFNEYNTPF